MNTENKMKVEVWSDVVCPFCYIGKRHFDRALAEFENADHVDLEFKSYQLDPNFIQDPDNKANLTEALAQKYNRSISEIEKMQENIVQMAKNAGLEYNLENAVQFNTTNAHRLLQLAKEKGLGNAWEEALFKAYFTEGKDLGNAEELKNLAMQVGLKEDDIDRALTGDEYAHYVNQDIQEAANLGVSGVPFFVFNRKYGVSGAQPKEAFLETLQKSYADWKESKSATIQNVGVGSTCDFEGNCK